MLLAYDIEVFPNCFIIDFFDGKEHRSFIFHKDVIEQSRENFLKLKRFINEINNNHYELISFNGLGFDRFVLRAFLERGFDGAWEKSTELVQKKHYLQSSDVFNGSTEYDLYQILPKTVGSLKKIQARLGVPIISWKHFEDGLPYKKIDECLKYCNNDTETTYKLFWNKDTQKFIKARQYLKGDSFYGNYVNKISLPDSQLGASIISRYIWGKTYWNEGRPLNPTLVFKGEDVLKHEFLFLHKEYQDVYKKILGWQFAFTKEDDGTICSYKNKNPFSLDIELVRSTEHATLKFGEGGLHLHGVTGFKKGQFVNCDVSSQYPSLVNRYAISPGYKDNKDKEKFLHIYNRLLKDRLTAKQNGDKVKSDALKIPLNSVIGNFRNPKSIFGDVSAHIAVVLHAQLSILLFIDIVQTYGIPVRHVNTDGVCVELRNDDDREYLDESIKLWESEFGLSLESTEFDGLLIIDTNNYAFFKNDTLIKGVGITNRQLDIFTGGTEPQIIGDAIREYYLHGCEPKQYIENIAKTGNIKPFLFIRQVSKLNEYAGIYRYYIAKDGAINAEYPKVSTLTNYKRPIIICNGELPDSTNYVDLDTYVRLTYEKIAGFNPKPKGYLTEINNLYQKGINIIPLALRGKRPICAWVEYQRNRVPQQQIQQWFSKPHNIGIVTGAISKLCVLDIDDANVGESYIKGCPQNVAIVKSGKGYHVYYRYNGETSKRLNKHMELKSDGCYIVAPPSIHSSGVSYQWIKELPENLDDLAVFSDENIPGEPNTDSNNNKSKRLWKKKPEEIQEGERNIVFASKAGKLLNAGLAPETVEQKLIEENSVIANPLPIYEVKAIAKSIVKTHERHEKIAEKSDFGDISDYNVAEHLTKYLDNLRFNPNRDTWYQWSPDISKWLELPNANRIDERYRQMIVDVRELYKKNPNDKFIKKFLDEIKKTKKFNNVLRFVRAINEMYINEAKIDEKKIYTAKHIIDFSDKQNITISENPNNEVQQHTNAEINNEAECPEWSKFLNAITNGDKEYQEFLQRFCGYLLYPGNPESKVFLMYGTGCNGKSTFTEVILDIVGDYGCTTNLSAILGRDASMSETSYEIAKLNDKRVVVASETQDSMILKEETLKNISGNERITARPIYGKPFNYLPLWKLIIHGNHKPRVNGEDKAVWRRLVLLPFVYTIPRESIDIHYREKLLKERDGIFRWVLAGLSKYLKEGLTLPQIVQDATSEYRMERCEFQEFLNTVVPFKCIPSKGMVYLDEPTKLYRKYLDWTQTACIDEISKNLFRSKMSQLGYRIAFANFGEGRKRYWARYEPDLESESVKENIDE